MTTPCFLKKAVLMRGRQRRMRGQAMIEYIVVLAFSVILLVKPFSMNGNTEAPAITQLSDAIKAYHKSYGYALNVAAIPECNYSVAFDKSPFASSLDISALPSSIQSAIANASLNTDRCIDWSNPQIPPVTFSGLPTLGDISTGIQGVIDSYINGIKDQLNPATAFSFNNPL